MYDNFIAVCVSQFEGLCVSILSVNRKMRNVHLSLLLLAALSESVC